MKRIEKLEEAIRFLSKNSGDEIVINTLIYPFGIKNTVIEYMYGGEVKRVSIPSAECELLENENIYFVIKANCEFCTPTDRYYYIPKANAVAQLVPKSELKLFCKNFSQNS